VSSGEPAAEPLALTEEVEAGEASIDVQAAELLAGGAPAIFAEGCGTGIVPAALVNASLRFLWANPAFESLFGADCRGEHLSRFFAGSFPDEVKVDLYAAVRSAGRQHCWRGIVSLSNARGAEVVAALTVIPVRPGPAGEPGAFACLLSDITDHHHATLRGTFISLLEASRLKDNDTGKHINRVGAYSGALAARLARREGYAEVDAQFIEDIGYLAAMHDVGKIGTSDNILNKEGPLTDSERGQMKEHTINGAYLLKTYPNAMAREIALLHHEWWNGSGYPYGLSGTMIPLSARIVAIADVYDALRMKRSYKAAMSHEKSVALIVEGKGTHFDPTLVEQFEQMAGEIEEIHHRLAD
jgi:HD-GYP domain-containing protein (c-di-GMP phosphodiesterase class II)